MKFAKITFLIAGIYGLIVLLPLYFMEQQTGRDYIVTGASVDALLGMLFLVAYLKTAQRAT